MAIQEAQAVATESTIQTPPREQRFRQGLEQFARGLGTALIKYWAVLITTVLGIIVGAAIATPILSYLGLDFIAKPIFFSLHMVCEQVPSHSFFLFGHQLGLCGRNFSIYTSMFLGSLVFVLTGKRLVGIPWWLWLLMILPMALDGVTQMFGLRESTMELRILTGTLFGLGNILFTLPLVHKNIVEATTVQYQLAPVPQVTPGALSLPSTPSQADTL